MEGLLALPWSGAVALVGNARVAKHILIDIAALDLAHGLDFLAVLFRFVMLLAVLVQALASFAIGGLGMQLAVRALLQLFDQAIMRLSAVHPFGMLLGALCLFLRHLFRCS
jgi:hypothetical protein